MLTESIHPLIEKIETALINVVDDKERRKLVAYKLRCLGYTEMKIAEELGISIGQVCLDLKWVRDNVPPVYESAEDFRRKSIPAMEQQIEYLLTPRTETRFTEDGSSYEVTVNPSETAIRVVQSIRDMIAKLLGAYSPVAVDATVTVKTVLEIDGKEVKT